MTDQWIVVPNWDRFQHYSDREPVWVKVYTELASRDDWRTLTYSERGMLVSIWVEFARARGVLRVDGISARLGQRHDPRTLMALVRAGWLQISASKPLALTRSREVEKKEEKKERAGARAREESAPAPALNSGLLARFDNWVKYEGFEYVDDLDAFVDELRRRHFIADAKSPLALELLERARGQVHA